MPISEQIISFGIGFEELLAFYTAVTEKAGMHNLPMGSAAYHVIEDIGDYHKLGGMKKELSNICVQVGSMNLISARQNIAITTVFKLVSHGITEEEILNRCNFLDLNKVIHQA